MRYLIAGIGLLVAGVAAGILIPYPEAEQEQDVMDHDTFMTVVVSRKEIPADQLLDPLMNRGFFEERFVSTDSVVQGAITDVDQLVGTITTTTILENEQISSVRLTADMEFDVTTIPPG